MSYYFSWDFRERVITSPFLFPEISENESSSAYTSRKYSLHLVLAFISFSFSLSIRLDIQGQNISLRLGQAAVAVRAKACSS